MMKVIQVGLIGKTRISMIIIHIARYLLDNCVDTDEDTEDMVTRLILGVDRGNTEARHNTDSKLIRDQTLDGPKRAQDEAKMAQHSAR